jgi:3-phenylpropionate/trans-cinnamate dioxygenase ferredoxin reductase subunit
MNGVVIVGAGQAGHQLAISLRDNGYPDSIVLVEGEDTLPYQRPPLSKDYLFDAEGPIDVALASEEDYAERGIEFLPGQRVQSVDRERCEVLLGSGEVLPYEHLVLATGVRARPLDVPGLPLAGVHTLRTVHDAEQLRQRLDAAHDVVVIGAGFIGLEFATGAVQRVRRVTVLEAAPRILLRSLSAETAAFLHERHTENGVLIRTNVAVAGFTGRGGRVAGVELADGTVVRADLVVVGIGVLPNDELAVHSGLAVDGTGIVVDEFLCTSDPSIHAIGDVVSFPNSFAHRRTRVESVQNAMDQARCLAATLSGTPCRYADLPWFWSQQAGHLVQIAGIGQGHDKADVHTSADPRSFSTFCYRENELIAVESIDQPRIHMKARRELRAPIA